MPPDTNTSLKILWKHEIAARKDAQLWNAVSNAGFIGLVATELPEFIAREKGGKLPWRTPLFFASSASIVLGVVMNLVRGKKAEAIRESALMIEHSQESGQPSANVPQWSDLVAQKPGIQAIAK